MGGLFNYNSPFIQTINKLVDCFFLGILWIVCSIPIFTFGAATTAIYYTVNKVIRHDRSHIWREFFKAFKSNFKQSTIVWVVALVIYYILSVDCIFIYNLVHAGKVGGWVFVPFVIMAIYLTICLMYIFAYIARFANNLKSIVKYSAFFVIRHFLRSILLFIIFAAVVILVICYPIAIVILPVLAMYLMTSVLEPIFRKYMSEEDLAAEEERNRIYYN